MAEEAEEGLPGVLTGFEQHDTKSLLAVRENMLRGLGEVAESQENGTLLARRKPGSANALEAGQTIVFLLDGVNEELKRRGELK